MPEQTSCTTAGPGSPAALELDRVNEGLRRETERLAGELAEQKQTVDHLLANEAYLNMLLDNILAGVFVIEGKTHRIVEVNRLAAEVVGLPREQIIGRVCHCFVCTAEEGQCPVSDLGQKVDRSERLLVKADGQTVPILKTVTPALWQGDEYYIESFVVITELKDAQDSLMESMALLSATLEATADGILVVDTAGRIKSFNRQFKDLWRMPDAVLDARSDDEVVQCVLSQVKEPEAFAAKIKEMDDAPEQGHFYTIETTDGRILELYSKPQRVSHQTIGQVASFRDVTAQRRSEKKQAELMTRVAEINEELSHFAYVVSHDLKAPLRGIKLLTEWLCADYADKLDDQAKEQMAMLQTRVQRMHNLIEGILQYSRVGRVREDMADVNLNELLPNVIDTIAPPSHIHVAVEGDLPTLVCERTRITQVFQNLLTNAVKYMDKPEGRITVSCQDQGDFWRFSVTDNGPGIEEKYFERIFQLFQTLVPKDEYESTGVGLTLVKKIVELYGGRVWVESQVGQGSTFLFTWPKQKADASCESPGPVPA